MLTLNNDNNFISDTCDDYEGDMPSLDSASICSNDLALCQSLELMQEMLVVEK